VNAPGLLPILSGARHFLGRDDDLKKSEKDSFSMSKGELEERLTFLREEKRAVEFRLKGINKQIGSLASELEIDLSPERAQFLRCLSHAEALARVYVDKMLNNYVELSKEIKENSTNISYLYLEVQIWLEDLYDAMRTQRIAFLETSDYTLDLLDKRYQNASIENYRFLFYVIRSDLEKQVCADEDLSDLLECMKFLEKQAFRFY
jgi:hypothetical protein